MTVSDFVSAIEGKKVLVVILDSDSPATELIKFYSGGQESLTATLLSRTISSFKLESASQIVVTLEAAG